MARQVFDLNFVARARQVRLERDAMMAAAIAALFRTLATMIVAKPQPRRSRLA